MTITIYLDCTYLQFQEYITITFYGLYRARVLTLYAMWQAVYAYIYVYMCIYNIQGVGLALLAPTQFYPERVVSLQVPEHAIEYAHLCHYCRST